MMFPKLSVLVATAAASASVASGAELTGYLMDRLCITNCERALADGNTGSCNPDGSNSFFTPQDHTGWCLLLPPCIESGYMLMSEGTDADGKHSIIANFTDDVSNQAVVDYIDATSSGKRVQFPLVTVVHADDAVSVTSDDGTSIVQVANAVIQDPWPTSTYDGADTTQVICSTASDADIDSNNMCFRSDVVVSKNDDKGMIVIQSNGCPDHENMSGGSAGVIANTQAEPGKEVSSAGSAGVCGGCGGCGGGGCDGCGGCDGGKCDGQGENKCDGGKCGSSGNCGVGGCDGGCYGCGAGNPCAGNPCAGGGECSNEGCGVGGDQGDQDGCAGCTAVCVGNRNFRELQCSAENDCCSGNKQGECGSSSKEGDCCSGNKQGDCCSGCYAGCLGSNCGTGCGTVCDGNSQGKSDCCSGCYSGCCASDKCDGCGSKKCCGGCGGCGGQCGKCGCGSKKDCSSSTHGPYDPMYQHYTMMIPQAPGTPGDATMITDDVVGIMSNGVLLDSHSQTWSYDECNGHSDKKHQYHYHIPPICYLKSMGVTFPSASSWWMNDAGDEVRPYEEMASQFPAKGSSPVVGYARDGFPIYALYDSAGDLQSSSLYNGDLDECNGKEDANGQYAYYITAHPPFAPKCLRGDIGSFSYATTDLACPKAGIKNSIEGVSAPQETPAPAPSSGIRAMPLLAALAPAMAAIVSFLL